MRVYMGCTKFINLNIFCVRPFQKWCMQIFCVKFTSQLWGPWSFQKGTWTTQSARQKILWSNETNLAWMQSAMSGENQAQLITRLTPSLPWSMVEAALCYGDVFRGRNCETGKDRGNNEWNQIQANPWWDPASDWGEDLHSSRTITTSIQPKQHWNRFRTRMWKSLSSFESHWKSVEKLEDCSSRPIPF